MTSPDLTAANIDKMAAGIPLSDADRQPWLDAVAAWITSQADSGGVISCSALRRGYRDRLRGAGAIRAARTGQLRCDDLVDEGMFCRIRPIVRVVGFQMYSAVSRDLQVVEDTGA